MAMLLELLKKKPSLTHDEFRTYYENQHAPLNLRHFSHIFTRYTRSYVGSDVGTPDPDCLPADVFTRIEFANVGGIDEIYSHAASEPGLQQAIRDDEEEFMDRDATHMLLTDDAVHSPMHERRIGSASLVSLYSRNPARSREEFYEHYETRRAPLFLSRYKNLLTTYSRSYVFRDFRSAQSGIRPVDVITCVDFVSPHAMAEVLAFTSLCAAQTAADEAEFFDTGATRVLTSTESRESIPHS